MKSLKMNSIGVGNQRTRGARLLGPLACVLALGACESAGPVPEDVFRVTVDSVVQSFDETEATVERLSADVVRVEVRGNSFGPPDVADAGKSTTLVLELDLAQLSASAAPQPFEGEATFVQEEGTSNYGWLSDEQISWVDAPTSTPGVIRAWIRSACFCSRYGDQVQTLQGELTIHSFDGARLDMEVALTVEGEIPYQGTGLDGPVSAVVNAHVDVDVDVE